MIQVDTSTGRRDVTLTTDEALLREAQLDALEHAQKVREAQNEAAAKYGNRYGIHLAEGCE